MRGTRAKATRRAARAVTVGQPTVEYAPRTANEKGALMPIVLEPTCTKAVHQRMKAELCMWSAVRIDQICIHEFTQTETGRVYCVKCGLIS